MDNNEKAMWVKFLIHEIKEYQHSYDTIKKYAHKLDWDVSGHILFTHGQALLTYCDEYNFSLDDPSTIIALDNYRERLLKPAEPSPYDKFGDWWYGADVEGEYVLACYRQNGELVSFYTATSWCAPNSNEIPLKFHAWNCDEKLQDRFARDYKEYTFKFVRLADELDNTFGDWYYGRA